MQIEKKTQSLQLNSLQQHRNETFCLGQHMPMGTDKEEQRETNKRVDAPLRNDALQQTRHELEQTA
eukprot:2738197-Alexandrium_andersonii.AAC.1